MWTMWLVISNTRSPEVITAEDPQPGIDNEEASWWRRGEEGQTVTTPQLFTELITLFQTSMTLASGNNGCKMHIQESLWLKKKDLRPDMKKNVGLVSKFTNIVSFVCLCKPLANTHYAQQMHNQTFQRSFFIWQTSCIKAVLTEAEQLASYSQSSGPQRPRVAQSVRTVYELPLQKNKAPRGCSFSLGQNYNKSSFDLIFSLAVRLNKWRPPRHTPHAPATANMWQELLWEGWMVKRWIISHPQHQRTISIWSVQSMN